MTDIHYINETQTISITDIINRIKIFYNTRITKHGGSYIIIDSTYIVYPHYVNGIGYIAKFKPITN